MGTYTYAWNILYSKLRFCQLNPAPGDDAQPPQAPPVRPNTGIWNNLVTGLTVFDNWWRFMSNPGCIIWPTDKLSAKGCWFMTSLMIYSIEDVQGAFFSSPFSHLSLPLFSLSSSFSLSLPFFLLSPFLPKFPPNFQRVGDSPTSPIPSYATGDIKGSF